MQTSRLFERLGGGMPSLLWEGWWLLGMAGLVVLIYSNTLQVPFLLDDLPNIEENPHLRLSGFSLAGLREAWLEGFLPRRPVANVSFALNYAVHGYALAGYHWVNLLIHVGTGLCLYALLKATLGLPELRQASFPGAGHDPSQCGEGHQENGCDGQTSNAVGARRLQDSLDGHKA